MVIVISFILTEIFYSGLQNYQKMDMLEGLCPTLFFMHSYDGMGFLWNVVRG